MGEDSRPYELTLGFAEVIHATMEADYHQAKRSLDEIFNRLKDLSAYSQEYAEIMDQREGVELLGLGMFCGMSGNPHRRDNRQRLTPLSEEILAY